MNEEQTTQSLHFRRSEDKLFQSCVDACIEGIEKLPVSTRRTSVLPATVASDENINTDSSIAATPALIHSPITVDSNSIDRETILAVPHEPDTSLLSPPTTPKKTSSPPPQNPVSPVASMNRTPLHGAPAQGQTSMPPHPRRRAPPTAPAPASVPASYGNQDARGNFAVQPAAITGGSFKLKKSAVKIVGAAAPTPPSTPNRALAPAAEASSPAPGPVKAEAKEAERVESVATKPKPSTASLESFQIKLEPSSPKNKRTSADLDDLFKRLTTGGAFVPSTAPKAASPAGPSKSEFSFESALGFNETAAIFKSPTTNLPAPDIQEDGVHAPKDVVKEQVVKSVEQQKEGYSQKELEQLYLRKAAEYVSALPGVSNVSVQIIKTVSAKLRSTYTPDTKLTADEAEKLKARYTFAIVNYINNVNRNSAAPITPDAVKKALEDCDGNMLALYGTLAAKGHLALDDIKGVVGLFQMIQDALPKAELSGTAPKFTARSSIAIGLSAEKTPPASEAGAGAGADTTAKDTAGLKAWPTQEKRDNPAMHRACILKGVSDVKSINQLQALVWGGRLESIALPSPGSDFAVVRFLTPEACEKYYKATENGIEVQGDMKKSLVFVEKQPGPTSINDVMRNCIEGDASRCVRAMDAEEDWSDILLMKLARGKGQIKREVDRIKRGKTARGRYFIEFRFASIYHALQFKRELAEDESWEPCVINYATDPCETARGVHYKDRVLASSLD